MYNWLYSIFKCKQQNNQKPNIQRVRFSIFRLIDCDRFFLGYCPTGLSLFGETCYKFRLKIQIFDCLESTSNFAFLAGSGFQPLLTLLFCFRIGDKRVWNRKDSAATELLPQTKCTAGTIEGDKHSISQGYKGSSIQ